MYFVDGSCFRDHDGNHAGCGAVVQRLRSRLFVTVKAELVPQLCSAQKAELLALTQVCPLAKGKNATIYTNSLYPHGICHYFGSIWHQHGFKKTDGTSIHLQQIKDLMAAMMQTKRLANVKCQAHRKDH